MPTYDSCCRVCGKEHQYIRTIQNYKDTPICCGVPTVKEIRNAPDVAFESVRHFENFKCPVTDQVISSERSRREVMAKHDLIDARELGTGKDHIKKAKKKHNELMKDDPNVKIVDADYQPV